MIPRDFDRQFDDTRQRIEANRRSIERFHRILVAIVILAALAGAIGLTWLLGHPMQIGEFFGLMAAGFGVAA